MIRRLLSLSALALGLVFASGCATVPYQYGARYHTDLEYKMPPGESQIEIGKPIPALDWVDWIWPDSLLGKIILLNYKVDSHQVSQKTIDTIHEYLVKNDLPNVKVRINQYAPGREWKRLFRNRSIAPGWRYTLGVIATAMYTALPGRFFGGDNYNPYTNTINIYSDIPAVALHEGGHAKDQANRKYKGTHAFLYTLPFFPLYYEWIATADAMGYAIAEYRPDLVKQGYRTLYPAYMTYVGGSAADYVGYPWNYAVSLGLVLPGHIVGQIRAALVDD